MELYELVICANWLPTHDLSWHSRLVSSPVLDFQSNHTPLAPSRHLLKVTVQGSCVLCAHRPALFSPNQLLFFFPTHQNGEMHHKGHGNRFPLVWLHEKVRWGHHEMAARPSRRPLRDPSPYITLKWHGMSPSVGRSLRKRGGGGSRGPVGPRLVPLCGECPSKVWRENRATNCDAEFISFRLDTNSCDSGDVKVIYLTRVLHKLTCSWQRIM